MAATRKTLVEKARDLADPDTRRWAKALELCDELDGGGYDGITDSAQAFIEAVEQLRSALDDKDGAMEETGEAKSDALANAWDEASGAMEAIAEAADQLEGLFAE